MYTVSGEINFDNPCPSVKLGSLDRSQMYTMSGEMNLGNPCPSVKLGFLDHSIRKVTLCVHKPSCFALN